MGTLRWRRLRPNVADGPSSGAGSPASSRQTGARSRRQGASERERPAPAHSRTSSAGEDGGRDREAKRPGGLEIDYQLKGGRLLHRQIGGLGATEDPPGVNADLATDSNGVRSIADQASGSRERTKLIARRNG